MRFARGRYTREEVREMFGLSTEPPAPPSAENTAPPRQEKAPLTSQEKQDRWKRGLALLDQRLQATAAELEAARRAGEDARERDLEVRIARMKLYRERLGGEDPLLDEQASGAPR